MLPNTRVMRLQGGRQVEFARLGTGEPVTILEAGGGMRMTTWTRVFSAIAAFTTVVGYNRAGFGNSSPDEAPRNGTSIVHELRAFLRELGVSPPYVLVGHSLGGLYMQLFARQYPHEVAGLVLVDPTPPFMAHRAVDALAPRAAAWAAVLGRLTKCFHALAGRTATAEIAAMEQTAQAVLPTPAPTDMPIIVLISARKSIFVSRRQWEIIKDIQRGLVDLFPGCQWRPVDCGHAIHVSAPQTVVSGIRECVCR